MLENIREKISAYTGTPPIEELKKAAVLIAVTDGSEPELIYTLRSNKVGTHGGEVSFPGGMYEEEDGDLKFTALRESEEETGLDISKVDLLGSTDTVVSRFNISVTPYVGIVPNDIKLNNNSDEIEACFRVCLLYTSPSPRDKRQSRMPSSA